jgi:hypothetical protein
MEIVGYILAVIGLAFIVKRLRRQEGCLLCDLQKSKVEGVKTKAEEVKAKTEQVKPKVENVKTKVGELKTKVGGLRTKQESEKRTGSRYGSNPVSY